MKKLTLLVGAALLVSAAHAQVRTSAPTTNPTAPTTRTAPTTAMTAAGTPQAIARPAVGGATSATSPIDNDSYVQQVGDNQQAVVSQTGTGRNSADIDQSPSSVVSSATGAIRDNNFASQTQVSTGTKASARNVAVIGQHGATSAAIQEQNGTGNVGQISQGGMGVHSEDNYAKQTQSASGNSAKIDQNTTTSSNAGNPAGDNSATQTQTASNNRAYVNQLYYNNVSEQSQSGESNSATATQWGHDNYVKQDQSGSSNKASISQRASSGLGAEKNQAIQIQSASSGDAIIAQKTANNFASQNQSGGIGNYADTYQGGITGTNSSYSVSTQTGSNNTVYVTQGAAR
ncbi:hypothetical protein ACFST9_11990 [Hymenobacter monticola]|uniref:Curlin n=1 Tax=Hymenobacter monticola TaxID=1705399 RepID=A0ABY4B9X5_9BACT|nr:hypothetical protein [Hymenobacter monticola]UOE35087.1 hypothetical protein MTP16_05420 [Hymenobacter monticola]